MTPASFADLLRRHAGLIHQVARTYARDAADRDDVAQEIAVQLWRSADRLDPARRESTWIWRVALNVAISWHRRERRHRSRRSDHDPHAIAFEPGPDPGEDLARLHTAIHELGDLDRALVLLWLDGSDHATTAEVLGISVTNVATRLHRSKAALRDRLTTPDPTTDRSPP
jgi:RNA polymerase sigma-70 factor (ECF subfamily)